MSHLVIGIPKNQTLKEYFNCLNAKEKGSFQEANPRLIGKIMSTLQKGYETPTDQTFINFVNVTPQAIFGELEGM